MFSEKQRALVINELAMARLGSHRGPTEKPRELSGEKKMAAGNVTPEEAAAWYHQEIGILDSSSAWEHLIKGKEANRLLERSRLNSRRSSE